MVRIATSRVMSVLIAGLALALPAAAQDEALSQRERAWVERLGECFGQVTHAEKTRDEPGPSGGASTGLLVVTGDTSVIRYKFASPAEAQQEAVQLIEGDGVERRLTVGEVRGDQVLVLAGPVARDPEEAREALDAAWAGLPAPRRPDATFALLGPHDVVLTTRLREGPLHDLVSQILEETRGLEGSPSVSFTSPDAATVKLDGGFESGFQVDGDGARLWTAQGSARARKAQDYMSRVGVESAGARSFVERLFGD